MQYTRGRYINTFIYKLSWNKLGEAVIGKSVRRQGTILEWILQKWRGVIWIGLVLLKIGNCKRSFVNMVLGFPGFINIRASMEI
jgi:hypothetical protein